MSPRRGGQDFTLCHAGDAEAGLGRCLPTAGTPCWPGSHPLSWASQISSLIPPVQELCYPGPRQPLPLGQQAGQDRGYFQPGWT